MKQQQTALLEQLRDYDNRQSNILKLLDGVIDVEMRNAEMKRILTHDPDISKALEKLEEDQRKAGIESISNRRIAKSQVSEAEDASISHTSNATSL